MNKPYHVYTDASDLQLGAVIMQEGQPVAFFSRKLNDAQRHYTTMEKELLSIVETLREFRTMLYGCRELHVHTDHKNLTYANLNSQRVMRWRLFLEEFNPKFHYIKGESNSLADALSRLPLQERQETEVSQSTSLEVVQKQLSAQMVDDDRSVHSFSVAIDDDEILGCFLNFPEVDAQHQFALDYREIANAQQNDHVLGGYYCNF
jgi:hypothetical protein